MFDNIYEGKKVLITGNTGFKGSWLSIWLTKLGADVYGIAKDVPTIPSMFDKLGLAAKVHHNEVDVRDLEKVKAIIREVKPEFVFHMAAQPIVVSSYKDPVETISTNVMGTMNVLEALRTINISVQQLLLPATSATITWNGFGVIKNPIALKGKIFTAVRKGLLK